MKTETYKMLRSGATKGKSGKVRTWSAGAVIEMPAGELSHVGPKVATLATKADTPPVEKAASAKAKAAAKAKADAEPKAEKAVAKPARTRSKKKKK